MVKAKIDFKENCKLRIRNADPSFYKHEMIKCALMLLYKQKHPTAGIYSEYPMPDGTIPDVVIDLGSEIVILEVQKAISPLWRERIEKRNKEAPYTLLVPVDTFIVSVEDMPNDINELAIKLKDYVV